jgi:hypothetical protein
MHAIDDPPQLVDLCIVANFVEVSLAREGRRHAVGINYLEKIQLPHCRRSTARCWLAWTTSSWAPESRRGFQACWTGSPVTSR